MNKLTSAVEAARSQIDGANDGELVIREDEFCVKLEVPQSVYPDADIIQRPQASYCLDKLGLWELVERSCQHES
jgi:hypothetical protein